VSSSLPPVAGIPAVSPTLSPSPSGNAAGLFPTLNPKAAPGSGAQARTRPVADTSALPEGAPVVGAQLAGLAALALAFVLAVTRLSVRRRPAPAKKSADAAGSSKPADRQEMDTPQDKDTPQPESADGSAAGPDAPDPDAGPGA
jgi:hypothetical protein